MYHPYERFDKKTDERSDKPAWKMISNKGLNRRGKGRSIFYSSRPRASSPIIDNHCIDKLQRGLLAGSQCSTKQTIDTCVNFHVVKLAHTAPGHSQKKEFK